MVAYTRFNVANNPNGAWHLQSGTIFSVTPTLVILNNDDGSQTRLSGTGFTGTTGGLTGGTITGLNRTDATGATIFASITGANFSAVTFSTNLPSYNASFTTIFSGADTLTGQALDDVLVGFGGADTLNGGGGFNTFFAGPGNDTITNSGLPSDGARATYETATGGVAVNLTGAWGTNLSTVTGNASVGTDTLQHVDNFRGSNFNDTYTVTASFTGRTGVPGDLFNVFEGMDGDDTINGNGQTRLEFTQASAAVRILVTGNQSGTSQSLAGGDPANVGVDTFTGIGQFRGSAFGDTFDGSAGTGIMQFEGRQGNDTLIGGTRGFTADDLNRARYNSASGGVAVSLGPVTSTVTGNGSVGTDTLIGIEEVRGSEFADVFTALVGFTAQFGAFNQFEGRDGNDSITGNGSTSVTYTNALAGMTVDLQAGTAGTTGGGNASGQGTDVIFGGVNQVRATDFNDTLLGSDGAQAERLRGNRGDDTINGRGGLQDIADYRNSEAAVTVNLVAGSAQDGFGFTDTLLNIEGARGGDHNDTLSGNGAANYFAGNGGDDTITGGAGDDFLSGDNSIDFFAGVFGSANNIDVGNDFINGGLGADTIYGGAGLDTSDYAEKTQAVVVFLDGNNAAIVTVGGANEDTIREIENINGGSGGDSLVGDGLANVFNGNGGQDFLFSNGFNPDGTMKAAAGNDTLNGGAGNDGLFAGDGGDTLNGGDGADGMVGGGGNDTLNGGLDGDFLFGGGFTTAGALAPNSGNDTLNGGDGNDGLWGQDGNDTINGDAGDDYVDAGDGTDTINGGAGSDTILGQGGADTINGGAGFDYLYGGGGADILAFNVDDSYDTYWDFVKAEGDTLRLDADLGVTTFAQFQARITGFVFEGANYTVLNFAVLGHNDQITIKGMATTDWTAGMVSFV